jgi:cation diffusion facilitator family transporter
VARRTHDHGHGHSHVFVDPAVARSRAGVRAVSASFGVLLLTAAAQVAIYATTSSVALLADLVHNFGDALTAVPLGIAFIIRSARAERLAGYAVVATVFASASFSLYETILRFIEPRALTHLPALAVAGVVGFLGNEVAAQMRLRAGKKLASPALIADGNHARVDGFVSLGVVTSAALVAAGLPVADPLVGLVISVLILRITWQSWQTVKPKPPTSTGSEGDG